MFQGLRSNSLIYILDKSEKPKLKIGQVVSVSNPQPKYNYGAGQFGQPMETFVDVVVKVGDEEINLKELPSNQNTTDCRGLVVTDNREAMCNEVDSMLRNSRMVIDSVPYHEEVISSCDEILKEINPQFAKEKEQEERLNTLEGNISSINNSLDNMNKMLSKFLETSKSK